MKLTSLGSAQILSLLAVSCVSVQEADPRSVAAAWSPQGVQAQIVDGAPVAVASEDPGEANPYWILGEGSYGSAGMAALGLAGPQADGVREPSWVEGDFDTVSGITTGVLVVGLGAVIATGNVDDIEEIGDYLQVGLPLLAFGSTAVARDWDGTLQYGTSLIVDTAFVAIMKDLAQKWRPNSDETGFASDQSFPSGHASAAWSGADFINRRYGPRWGAPAYVLGAYTGYSRIQADKHHTDDVLAGISFATFFNRAFVTPIEQDSAFAVQPAAIGSGFGLQVSLVGKEDEREKTVLAKPHFDPKYRYELEFGGVWQEENSVQAPESAEAVDFTDNAGTANPTTTASAVFNIFLAPRHQLDFGWWPFESRDIAGPTSKSLTLGDGTFVAGTELRTLYFLSDMTARYRYDLIDPDEALQVKVGGGLSLQYSESELQDLNSENRGVARDFTALPMLHLHLGCKLGKRWLLFTEADGSTVPGADYFNGLAEVRFQLNHNWDFGAGYRYYMRNVRSSDYKNDVVTHRGLLSVGYSF